MRSVQCSPGVTVLARTRDCHVPSLFTHTLSHAPSNPRVLIRPPHPGLPWGCLLMHAPQTPTPAFLAISCSLLGPSPDIPFSSKSPLFRSTWDPMDFPQP